ncbi:unnamed protein product [Rhodiola kirilowii]
MANAINLQCRMYESKYPSVGATVMVQVKNVAEADLVARVSLLEYNNTEGMIQFSELSKRRIRSVVSTIRVGNVEPLMVVNVNEEKGYVDLSRRNLNAKDVKKCEERFTKSKTVHSIFWHVAETLKIDLEKLYVEIGWPLYRNYGHAFEAFKLIAADPDSDFDSLNREVQQIGSDGQEETKVAPAISEDVKNALVKVIKRRMTLQPLKLRADIHMKCFVFDGVEYIKDAMRRGLEAGTDDCPVKMKLIAAPLYVLTAQTLDREQGISVLQNAITACTEEIERHGGKLEVMKAPRVVNELLPDEMVENGNDENGDDEYGDDENGDDENGDDEIGNYENGNEGGMEDKD